MMQRLSVKFALSICSLCIVLAFSTYLITNQTLPGVQAVSNLHPSTRPQTSTGDWSTYQSDLRRSGFNSYESIINQKTVGSLAVQWTFNAGASISSQPLITNGKIYWGDWNGYEHATDFMGNDVWKSPYLGKAANTQCYPTDAGVASAATFASVPNYGNMVFVGGGTASFYALDAKTGAIIWQTSLGTSPNYMLWGSSAYFNGNVYVDIASYGDCPLIRGGIVEINALTGAVQATFNGAPQGCLGDDIWSAPTIDVASNLVYVATGNGQCSQTDQYSEALIALDANTLTVIDSWQISPADQVNDGDFGSTPTLFQATINGSLHQMIGLVNKNGYFYALDRTQLKNGPLWKSHISEWTKGSHVGKNSISTASWDGNALYVAGGQTIVKGKTCHGSLSALDPTTGSPRWKVCLNAPVVGAVVAVTGLVFAGYGKKLIAVNAATGQILFTFTDTHPTSLFWGSASISNGMLVSGNADGILYNFQPPPSGTPTPTPTPAPTPTPNPSPSPSVSP